MTIQSINRNPIVQLQTEYQNLQTWFSQITYVFNQL